MERNVTLQQQIDGFLNNTMSQVERIAFEKMIKNQPNVRQEVELERFVRQGLKTAALKKQFQTLHGDITDKDTETKIPQNQLNAGVFRIERSNLYSWVRYATAACITGVAVGFWFFYSQSIIKDDSSLAVKQPSKSIEIPATKPSQETATITNSKRVTEDFLNDQEQGQLLSSERTPINITLSDQDRIAIFERYFDTNDRIIGPLNDIEKQLNNGIEALIVGQTATALESFHSVVSVSTDQPLRQKAQWLASLAYLRANQMSEATKLLHSIKQTKTHVYQQKANLLYKRVR
jgi:hypothetical protein